MPYIFDDKVNRRRFIKTVGAATVGAGMLGAISGCASASAKEHALQQNTEGLDKWGREAGEWIPTCCNMCGSQSGIMVHVVDGVVEKIEPNHWNPNNYTNISADFFDGYTEDYGCKDGGSMCPKGHAGVMQLYDPDRIKTPLKRGNVDKSPGADPLWQEISWEQALDEIAKKMRTLKDAGEAHKLLWMSEDHSFTHIQQDFCEFYGTPNYLNHSNLCDVARKAAFKTVLGYDRPLADFIESKYIMLFGWNPTSAIKWVHLPRIITQALERGARMVVVDPYLSDTAAKAHEWVSIRPATDGALALAMGHVIIRDGLYDKEFVANWVSGFEEYAAFVKDKTPAWAEKITTVPAETIERLARELATTRPALVDVWSGPGQHTNGVQGGRAIAALNALIGTIDRPGGMVIPNKKGNDHQHIHPAHEVEKTLKQLRFDELDKYPLGHKSGVYTQLFSNLAEGKGPYQPKMMMCVFQNPMMSVPGPQTTAKALAKLDCFVVIDTMMSETALMADYVLPGTTYFERYDLNTHWVTWPVLALRQPVVKPLFGQPAEYEVVVSLGRRLNLLDEHGNSFFKTGPLSGKYIKDVTEWYEDFLSNEIVNAAPKMTLEELKQLPGAVWVDEKGTKFEKYTSPLKAEKLIGAFYDGPSNADGTRVYDKPKADKGKSIGTVFGGKVLRAFDTPSGKVELFSPSLAKKKDLNGKAVDPLPVYTARDWQPDDEYPLFLINWKEASHTHTRTQNNAWLLEIKAENPLIIHPDTAAGFGIGDGDEVWVESPHGKVKAKAQLTTRIHPEVVGAQHGFGHNALGKQAKGRGSAFGGLNVCKSDPLSGQSVHKEICVRISKA
jgi:thiosulfate reductase/polysulfide reductase chain A